jgi:hypothetical protein
MNLKPLQRTAFAAALAAISLNSSISCGRGRPSDAQAREVFREIISADYLADGRAELTDFRKIDGIPGDIYQYEYEATLTCLKNWNFGWGPKPDGKCRPGKKITLTGKLNLQRTENGWRHWY